MLITEAFARYDQELEAQHMKAKTRQNYKAALNSFVRSNGDLPVELVTYDVITRWKLHMTSYGYQSSYIKTTLSKIREVFKFLRKQGVNVIDSRDIDLPSVIKNEPVWLDYSEVQTLINIIESPRDKAIVAALFATGARVSELLQLNRESINNFQAPVIGKGDKAGIIYFDRVSMQLIDDYLAGRKDQLRPLFVSGQYRRITVSRVEQLIHKYADMAGIDKNVTPHVFRHSFASDLILNGADIYTTSKLLRHNNISTTQIYAHIKQPQNEANYHKYHSA